MAHEFFHERLYPMQDKVLAQIAAVDTGFYLTGGTAASRGYLHHRFSDDLDLFVNDDERFGLWTQRVIQTLTTAGPWSVEVVQRESRLVRVNVADDDLVLKIEMVNDVPAHVGGIRRHPGASPRTSPTSGGSAAVWDCRARPRSRTPRGRPPGCSRPTWPGLC